MLDEFRAENFDLGLSEIYDQCGFGLFHLIGIKKYIACSSTALNEMHATMFGVPYLSSFVPGLNCYF
jgi:hypothetical protein